MHTLKYELGRWIAFYLDIHDELEARKLNATAEQPAKKQFFGTATNDLETLLSEFAKNIEGYLGYLPEASLFRTNPHYLAYLGQHTQATLASSHWGY